jgi:hypothetical protein
LGRHDIHGSAGAAVIGFASIDSQMLWLVRNPFTLMAKLEETDVGVLLSGSAELTPRPRAASAAKLRFSVAISLI